LQVVQIIQSKEKYIFLSNTQMHFERGSTICIRFLLDIVESPIKSQPRTYLFIYSFSLIFRNEMFSLAFEFQ